MAPEKIHLRHCMLYEFRQGKKATEATATICSVYGEDALSVRVCQQWFVKFRNNNFDLEDEQRSGKPRQLTSDDLQALLDENPRQSTRELAETLHVDQSTVARRLHEMGKIQKAGRWVPHKLSAKNMEDRKSTCATLLERQRQGNFLLNIITGDEKWIMFDNPDKKKSWLSPGEIPEPQPMPEVHQKKVMLCVWWDMKGIIYYELLESHQTVTAERYRQQLQRVAEALQQKRPIGGRKRRKVLLLHDNARPHVATIT